MNEYVQKVLLSVLSAKLDAIAVCLRADVPDKDKIQSALLEIEALDRRREQASFAETEEEAVAALVR